MIQILAYSGDVDANAETMVTSKEPRCELELAQVVGVPNVKVHGVLNTGTLDVETNTNFIVFGTL